MAYPLKIGTREVGPGHPTFVVAEIGSNHGGSLDAALALIDAAADAGADAVKFQLWNPDKMYDPNQFPDEYASAVKWQLPRMWLPRLRERATERGLAFGCSAFDFESLDFVDQFVDFHKVASIEATWLPFVKAIADRSSSTRPMLMSLGGTSEDELVHGKVLNFMWPLDGFVPMHCTIAYPAQLEDTDLGLLRSVLSNGYLVDAMASSPWGLSDHTTHPTIAPCAAVALGACVIEKHLRNWDSAGGQESPDFYHSLDPGQFAFMVREIRQTEQVLGSSEKRIRPSEEKYLVYRRGPRGLRGA